MSFSQEVSALYGNKYRPLNCRQIVLPGIATGIGTVLTAGAALTYGILVDVALPAAIATDTLVVGIALDTPSGGEIYTIDIGSTMALGVAYANGAAVTVAGAASIADSIRAVTRIEIATDAGGYVPFYLPEPIWIPNGTGITTRGYTVGGTDTIGVSVICLQNFE